MIYDILPVNNYSGNDVCTKFDFDFYIENENQLKVYLYDKDNIKKELKYNVDYSINEFCNNNGGYIIFPLETSAYSILSSNEKISLELSLKVAQETQYNNSSLLNLDELEHSFDYLTRLIQIVSRKLQLCVKVSEWSNSNPDDYLDEINKALLAAKEYSLDATKRANESNGIYTNVKKMYDDIIAFCNQLDNLNSNLESLKSLVNTKAGLDLSNIDDTAKQTVFYASNFLSGNKRTDLTFTNSQNYTAEADGWFYLLGMFPVNAMAYLSVYRNGTTVENCERLIESSFKSDGVGYWGAIVCPVKKGDNVFTKTNTSIRKFQFIYAYKGEEE